MSQTKVQLLNNVSGDSGIGTASPESKLAIKGSSGNADLFSISDVGVPTSGGEFGVAMIKTNSTEFALNITGYNTASKGLKIYNNGASAARTSFEIAQAAGTKFIVDGVGNVGIGTSSPDTLLHLAGGSPNIKLHNTGSSANANDVFGSIIFQHSDSDDAGITAKIECVAEDTAGNSRLSFHNGDGGNADERMRINSDGKIGIGTTIQDHLLHVKGSSAVLKIDHTSTGDTKGVVMRHARGGLSGFNGKIISFIGNDNSEEGSINIHTTSVAYNTSSDYRLKENEVAITDGITRLKTLKPYKFNFKKDPDVKVDGFLHMKYLL